MARARAGDWTCAWAAAAGDVARARDGAVGAGQSARARHNACSLGTDLWARISGLLLLWRHNGLGRGLSRRGGRGRRRPPWALALLPLRILPRRLDGSRLALPVLDRRSGRRRRGRCGPRRSCGGGHSNFRAEYNKGSNFGCVTALFWLSGGLLALRAGSPREIRFTNGGKTVKGASPPGRHLVTSLSHLTKRARTRHGTARVVPCGPQAQARPPQLSRGHGGRRRERFCGRRRWKMRRDVSC